MTLSPAAEALFRYLPASYGTGGDDVDPIVARWLEALAFELERLGALLEALRSTTVPAVADDTVGGLRRWEAAMGLPVEPAASIAQRRAWLLAAIRGRRVAAGADWTASMQTAIGSGSWEAHENTPGPNQITIDIPFAAGSAAAGQIAQHARRKTPANQQLIYNYTGAFIVGVSSVGDEL